MNPRKLYDRFQRGALQNVAFADFVRLLEAFGFRLKRVGGSHRIYSHPKIDEDLIIQSSDGEAKPYQIQQFMRVVERYNMAMREDQE